LVGKRVIYYKRKHIMSENLDFDLKNSIRDFVNKTLDEENPKEKCFTMCYILSVYLTIFEIEHSIKSGFIKGIGHYIITLKSGLCIDPTAKQINEDYDKVLIKEKLYDEYTLYEIDFDEIYQKWEYPLLNNGLKPLENENSSIDIIPYLKILYRSYLIIKEIIKNQETKGLQIQNIFIKDYIEKTKKIISENKEKYKY
jgi:hypothetical protein